MKHILPFLLSLLLLPAGCARQDANPAPAPPVDLSISAAPSLPVTQEDQATQTIQDTATEAGTEAASEAEEPYVRTIDPAAPMVALTFDDGPHETYSNDILDILERHHAVATFFEIGRSVYSYPEVLVRMDEMGCEIGSHSYRHADLSLLSQKALLADLQNADNAFIYATGKAPTLVRPPYGAVNKTVKSTTGRSIVTWTVDTYDWLSQDADTVIEYIKGLPTLDGEIVLMHSTYASTVEAVKALVPWLQEQGYQLVTVSELMAYCYGDPLQPNQFYGYTYFSTHDRTDTPAQAPAQPIQSQIPSDEHAPPVIIQQSAQTPAQPPQETAPPADPPEPPSEQPPAGEEDPELPPAGEDAPEPPSAGEEDPELPPAGEEDPEPPPVEEVPEQPSAGEDLPPEGNEPAAPSVTPGDQEADAEPPEEAPDAGLPEGGEAASEEPSAVP